ncbi:MAG: flagellar FliJ family protein [Pseudomonadota bacterium]
MTAQRREKLAVVRRYADRLESEAAGRLAAVANDAKAAEQLLQELVAYRSEYLTPPGSRQHWQAQHWDDYYEFLRRLDRAVTAQQEIVEQHEQRVRAVREEWQRLRMRSDSLEHMDKRLLKAEQQHAEQIAQKEADAWTLIAAVRQAH